MTTDPNSSIDLANLSDTISAGMSYRSSAAPKDSTGTFCDQFISTYQSQWRTDFCDILRELYEVAASTKLYGLAEDQRREMERTTRWRGQPVVHNWTLWACILWARLQGNIEKNYQEFLQIDGNGQLRSYRSSQVSRVF